jgi:hypothetical protein
MKELDKWSDAQPMLAVLRDFLEWCDREGIDLAKPLPSGQRYMPIIEDREHLLARHLDIDLNRLERERMALLKKASGG